MVQHKAHDVRAQPRTEDIQVAEDINFKSMLLPKPILHGLKQSGYIRPSPIQRKAIPLVRCGMDLIVQAKAGTGKTCVFTLAALEQVQPQLPHLQAVVLAPVREIAMQIVDVIQAIGQSVSGLKTRYFIGGFPLKNDEENVRGCHIAVGTPGRMRQLIDRGLMVTKHVRLFVLDEADKLMEEAFVKDINAIFSSLPVSKQVLACSATYTPELVDFLSNYMHRGQYVSPQHTSAHTTVLIGVRQMASVLSFHVNKLATMRAKESRLLYLLSSVSFNQCLVFSNLHSRAVSVRNVLKSKGWSVEWIAGRQDQADRVKALAQLKQQKVRVLVTTDLTARGIDVDNVNLVINLDLPLDHHTYLHRMGRAGRYGSHGMVITILSAGAELESFKKILGAVGGTSQSAALVPEKLKDIDLWTTSDENLECVCGISPSATAEEASASQENCSMERSEKKNRRDDARRNGKAKLKNPFKTKSSSESDSIQSLNSDETLSTESDKENVASLNATTKEGCSCNLYTVDESDIEVIVEPSIFTVSEKEDHWHDVLPITVNEFKIPLNSPIALLGGKIVRVKSCNNKHDYTTSLGVSTDAIVDFETVGSKNVSSIMSFEDIQEQLEHEIMIDLGDESNARNDSELLSFDEIQSALEADVAAVLTEKNASCEKLKQVEELLEKHQNNSKALEKMMSAYDSFDIVGWMATDETEDMLQVLNTDDLYVAQYCLLKCYGGKSHIQVNMFPDCVEQIESEFQDKISTLNLERLHLVRPITLNSITDKLQPPLQNGHIKSITSKPKNATNKNADGKNVTNGKMKNGTRECSEQDESFHQMRSVLSRHEPSTDEEERVRRLEFRAKKQKVLYCAERLAELLGRESNIDSSKTRAKNQSVFNCGDKYGAVGECIHGKSPKDRLSDPSSDPYEESEELSFSEQSEKVCCHIKPETASDCSESSASGPYVDMSLKKWQQLHNPEESDTTELEYSVLRPRTPEIEEPDYNLEYKQRLIREHQERNKDFLLRQNKETFVGKDTYSETTSSSEELLIDQKCPDTHSSNHMRQVTRKQSKSRSRRHHLDPDESKDSEATNQHSFKTACSHHHTEERLPLHTQFTGICENHTRDHRYRLTGKQPLDSCTSHRSSNMSHEHKRRPVPNVPSVSHSYKEAYQSSPNQREMSHRWPQRLRSNNLFSDWYSTWYSEIRQVAEGIAKVEYINSMSKP